MLKKLNCLIGITNTDNSPINEKTRVFAEL